MTSDEFLDWEQCQLSLYELDGVRPILLRLPDSNNLKRLGRLTAGGTRDAVTGRPVTRI